MTLSTVEAVDSDLRETLKRFERAVAEDNADLAETYHRDFDRLLDRRNTVDPVWLAANQPPPPPAR